MILIRFPIDPRLHAHARGHWRPKSEATRNLRGLAKCLAMQVGNKKITGIVVVDYTFYVPDMVTRDTANMIQACKPAIDGVVDARMIEADGWRYLLVGRCNIAYGPKLEAELRFRAASDDEAAFIESIVAEIQSHAKKPKPSRRKKPTKATAGKNRTLELIKNFKQS